MNAPQFLRRRTPNDERQVRGLPPLPDPVDLDAAATVDLYAGRVKQQRTEAQAVGDLAQEAVMRATQLSKEVMQMVDRAKAVATDIEREGLRLIAEVQRQQDDFNRRTENFIESATTLHTGLIDTLAKVGKEKTAVVVEADTKMAAELETDIVDVVKNKAAERK